MSSELGVDGRRVATPPSSTGAPAAETSRAATTERARHRLLWMRETALVVVFYYVYQAIRNIANSGNVSPRAFANANRLVALERHLHIFVEDRVQEFFLQARWFIKAMNVYYGTLHFVITVGLLVWVYHYRHHAYRTMRNLLGATTALALIGYWAFPLAPPRMFPCNCFEDTLDTIGGLWSYNSPVAKALANPFAAMPSLHFGWALWCGIVFWTLTRHRWSRALAFFYPLLTLMAIVVTANHYFLDAAGGAVILIGAVLLTRAIERSGLRRRQRRELLTATVDGAGASPGSTGDASAVPAVERSAAAGAGTQQVGGMTHR